mmetsp:Transcript_9874/g.22463  ORF Transcript_9874/g.22463 Transcript_9874/m.22463 type:complete len:89 (+) Transcript_9874:391-657(+)
MMSLQRRWDRSLSRSISLRQAYLAPLAFGGCQSSGHKRDIMVADRAPARRARQDKCSLMSLDSMGERALRFALLDATCEAQAQSARSL